MPPARPYWKGYLKLSLVSCPIALYTGTSSTERVSFRQINKKTGNRLRQQLVDEITRAPVESFDKGRGYEYAKNAYVPVDDDELDGIAIDSNHTMEIDSFVPRQQIDERYLDSPYHITPNDQVGQEAFAVIREAMRDKGMAALGRVVLAKRERVIMLQPWDKGLMGTTLRYAYEVRDTADLFSGIRDMKIAKDMLALAEHILETKAGEFDPENFHDRYEDAVVEMLRRKQAGMPAEIAKPAAPQSNVVSLMDALKKSLAAENSKAPAASGKAKKPKKKVEGQREMLLPIAGKGAGKADAAKPAAKAAPAKTGARQRKAS